MIKFLIVVALMVVLASLFSALVFLVKDQGRGERVVNALLVRVAVSAVLLVAILLLIHFGVIHPNPSPY